ncbi:DUF6625 family protein [Clostridium butyricum]|uniref:DUF6625 family protein n=1 Tax=Clostridium butyricum TaxID=1492 RepID=UPI0022E52303|nr:DUF6625 family protein [Clostridium butyricum]
MRNKCCFIIPYFGVMPNYFQLFLNSCKENKAFNWIIFTDDETCYNYPSNVKKISMNMIEFKDLLLKKFDFTIRISNPHKLCDLKPAYGYIFEEYIKKYEFWGHCDVDLIFGKLSNFINDDLLEQYDKLFCLGHCIIYRNNFENNRVFMKAINGEEWYKESFQMEKTTAFDETCGGTRNVNTIFLHYNKKVLMKDWSMNSLVSPANFIKVTYSGESDKFEIEKSLEAIYLWNQGSVIRYYFNENKFITEEFMYIHLQSRAMKIKSDIYKKKNYKILGNGFYLLEVDNVTKENFKIIKKKIISLRYIKINIKWKINAIKRIIFNKGCAKI